MAYYNPVTTIASVGSQALPVPVTIASTTEPTKRENGGDLRQGDQWFNTSNGQDHLYVEGIWRLVGTGDVTNYQLPEATTTTLGGVIVGTNLAVTAGVISLSQNPVITTLQTNSTLTAHTIVTGAENGVAINASAGEITAKWLNIAKNPTTDENDSNYNVSLRTTGTVITPEANVTTLSGARQGMIYKLSLGDGLTFRGQASSHIGGTVGASAASGNQYSTNSGTIDLDGVMRTTGTQTLTGDLIVAAGVGDRTGTIKTVGIKLESPNGTEYLVTVGDDGTLISTAI